MRKIFYLLAVVVLLGAVFLSRNNLQNFVTSLNPCGTPITYRIGDVDRRFDLSDDQVLNYAKDAVSIWNNVWPTPLFVYSSDGLISVNMVYDQRQSQSSKINQLDTQLEAKKQKLAAAVKAYEAKVGEFKKKLQDHNRLIETINAQGGASGEEYEKLIAQQEVLSTEAAQLNGEARNLNITGENYNVGVADINSEIQNFNKNLVLKPEEGVFIGEQSRIEIYFSNDPNELVHTIAHEFGHAIGVSHVAGSDAIMFAYTSSTVGLSTEDVAVLELACAKKTIFEELSERIRIIIGNFYKY